MREFLQHMKQMTNEEIFSEQKRVQKLPPHKKEYKLHARIVDMLMDNELNERLWQQKHWQRLSSVL